MSEPSRRPERSWPTEPFGLGHDPVRLGRPRPPRGDVPRLRARTPADLLELVPYLLGFHPRESLVLLVLRRGEVAVAARFDLLLPDRGRSRAALVREYAARTQQIVAANEGTGLVAAVYTGRGERARRLALGLAEGLQRFGLLDALLVTGDRWWSLTCSTPGCCPPEGSPYDVAGSVLAAEAVYHGLSAAEDRSALVRLVAGPPPERLPALRQQMVLLSGQLAGAGLPERSDQLAALIRDHLVAPAGELDAVRLAVLATDLRVRDLAWAMIEQPRAEDHQRLWLQVVAASPPELAPAPLCLVGMAAWVSGNGALQVCAMERALALRPGYHLAELLGEINDQALSPRHWPQLGESLRMLAGLDGGPLG